jgi:hypothetical protein
VTAEEADRLVKHKVAEYAEVPAAAPADEKNKEQVPYNKDMKLTKLQEVAKTYGIDASKMREKSKVIEAIEAKITADNAEPPEDDGEDSEEQPALNTADPEGAGS